MLIELRCTVCRQRTKVDVNDGGNPWHPSINFVHRPCQAPMERVLGTPVVPELIDGHGGGDLA